MVPGAKGLSYLVWEDGAVRLSWMRNRNKQSQIQARAVVRDLSFAGDGLGGTAFYPFLKKNKLPGSGGGERLLGPRLAKVSRGSLQRPGGPWEGGDSLSGKAGASPLR